MKTYTISALWGIAGIFVSTSIINTNRISFLGWPLFILSLLMFVLAIKQFIERKN